MERARAKQIVTEKPDVTFSGVVPVVVVTVFLLWVCSTVFASGEIASLREGFARPPREAGIRCFWWWLNSNVTKEAIRADLEQMKEKGFSGALIFDAGGAEQRGNRQVPAGPTFGSDGWKELFKYAVQQADRLGLELSLTIQSGWNLGGPTVTPEQAAKMLTWSETSLQGPQQYDEKLDRGKSRYGYYRDIAVLAYRSEPGIAADSHKQGHRQARRPIRDLRLKAAFDEVGMAAPDCRFLLKGYPPAPGEQDVNSADIVNLTDKLDSDGRLKWDVPAGQWTVLRFGYTPTDARVSTSSGTWQGLVIDYLAEESLAGYWNEVVEPLLAEVGGHAGGTLKYVQTDSWECGGANWTPEFVKEFGSRRGYDPVCYLPVIAGKIVDSRQVSNRFLADFRKTIGDCVAENHYKVLAELAHRHNMGTHPESGGPHAGPFDALKCLGYNDIPMGEFWVPSGHRPKPVDRFYVKQASSAAHIYNRQLVGAESFTSIGPHWNDVLWASQQPSFCHQVCSGLNLVFVHTFTCSPQEMGLPGQEYFAGTHFNRNVTWWEQAGAFVGFLNRCQYVMQRGRCVADVLYYYGDHVPNVMQYKQSDPAGVLPGYDYDVTNEQVLLERLEVDEGRLVLPGGRRYRLLVLPDHKVLSREVLEKVARLVEAGATVLGPRPETTASLVGYPECEGRLQELAGKLWGESDSGENRCGSGRVIQGKSARQVLRGDGVKPDLEITGRQVDSSIDIEYIHRVVGGADVYFISNQFSSTEEVDCIFRVTGKQPEIWDPVTGQVRDAAAFGQEDGRTLVPLRLRPYGSLFVVFAEPIAKTAQGEAESNFADYEVIRQLSGPWEVSFDPDWGGPGTVEFAELVSWTERPEEGIKYYSGEATYRKTFTFDTEKTQDGAVVLDLGEVRDVGIGEVRLNGVDLGVFWAKPFRVEITGALKDGSNELEVDVVNSWRNRLVGDRSLPEEKRYTRTNITVRADWKLLESGLLGPVRILASK